MQVGDTFKLIGRTTVFRAVHVYDHVGFIPSVVGHTVDGKFQTVARLADVERL